MNSNVTSTMPLLVKRYDPTKLNHNLPTEESIVLDAQSSLSEEELSEKATKQFAANNTSPKSCERVISHVAERLESVVDPNQNLLNEKAINTEKFHTRLVPKDQIKRTVMTKVIFIVIAIAAFATPMIAWFAMSNYLVGSGLFPDFYEHWWKPFLFSFLGVSSTFIFKIYEDRVLKSDEEKRLFIRRAIWFATAMIAIWIGLFSALFSFAEEGMLEGTASEALVAWIFTIFHLVGETVTGYLIWSYAIFINNKNKILETQINAEYVTAKELELTYSAEQIELTDYLCSLNEFIERYESSKSVYVASYLSRVSLHRSQINHRHSQATLSYINELQTASIPNVVPHLVHGE